MKENKIKGKTSKLTFFQIKQIEIDEEDKTMLIISTSILDYYIFFRNNSHRMKFYNIIKDKHDNYMNIQISKNIGKESRNINTLRKEDLFDISKFDKSKIISINKLREIYFEGLIQSKSFSLEVYNSLISFFNGYVNYEVIKMNKSILELIEKKIIKEKHIP